MRVEGHVAMVTGGGSGIGRACALMLAQEGADIVVADIDAAAGERVAGEVKALGRDALTLATDTSVKSQVRKIVAEGTARFGKIDILVNNAGIGAGGPVRDLDEAVWDRVVSVHLKSMFLCSQAVMESMIQRGWGRIVNTISRAAFRGRAGVGPYSAAKGGMLAFSRVLAVEAAQYGITVNNVAPGTTVTPMVEAAYDTLELQEEEARTSGVVTTPVRLAWPEEIAAAVLYYCGPHSDQVTGMTIHVNGGSYMP
ncbi:MAG: SDR family oxidoreductase [Chloroflexi bacterium]|nr:SDR family oxidoreductase [Chloroflexota bacterium]